MGRKWVDFAGLLALLVQFLLALFALQMAAFFLPSPEVFVRHFALIVMWPAANLFMAMKWKRWRWPFIYLMGLAIDIVWLFGVYLRH